MITITYPVTLFLHRRSLDAFYNNNDNDNDNAVGDDEGEVVDDADGNGDEDRKNH